MFWKGTASIKPLTCVYETAQVWCTLKGHNIHHAVDLRLWESTGLIHLVFWKGTASIKPLTCVYETAQVWCTSCILCLSACWAWEQVGFFSASWHEGLFEKMTTAIMKALDGGGWRIQQLAWRPIWKSDNSYHAAGLPKGEKKGMTLFWIAKCSIEERWCSVST